MDNDDIVLAHRYCTNNKKELQKDKKCGCFYCLKIYNPKKIFNWIMEGNGTALCPFCGIDSVIGESSGYPIETDFLQKMKEYWFG